jgi:zinc finger FYVE domain-containing protein 26
MGWDLLSGKTTARRNLMQLLWASKSQVLRLEESSLYGNQSDEVRNFYGNNSFGTI